MWAFLSRRFRQWLFLAVVVPLGSRAFRRLRAEFEKRRQREPGR